MKHAQYLFVYGTLCRHPDDQTQHPFLDDCEYMGHAFMHGNLYEIDSYPGAVTSCTTQIKGELYLLRAPERTLSVLDIYEECTADFPQPHEYIRRQLLVNLPDGQSVFAWTYLYNRPATGLQRILSGDYIHHLKDKS
ncbi:gamma-glutamylcyclotransferase family protein [Methylomonas fluvii]|uniref:Gamma-glutamylcyclotransferase n=1 Tax=Methylomonas fluvii TaxID=1854564 RepID=A0ABR9DD37_9GAMM|nr:gamma-glutamylcyclotransferase family protein [Methylomonas fluvii]MBD9361003.1 gamma-glutamylcyclotransferase [Methylomonas fluvii]CAD6873897.1 hypothetical protein [Methylomonas fluvii]